jgi:hypothetical protein
MSNSDEMLRLHLAGATVRHASPFADLPSHNNEQEISDDFIKKWVVPYYMNIGGKAIFIKEVSNDITPEICLALLGDFNWRTRLVGAYFSATKGYTEFIDIIGVHLLKSEVCCVGHIYALTLAHFNTEKSIQYLHRYLDYYLTRPDLYFDQKHVIEAMLFLDAENAIKYIDSWNLFEQKRLNPEKKFWLKIWEKISGKSSSFTPRTISTTYFEKKISILRDLSKTPL